VSKPPRKFTLKGLHSRPKIEQSKPAKKTDHVLVDIAIMYFVSPFSVEDESRSGNLFGWALNHRALPCAFFSPERASSVSRRRLGQEIIYFYAPQ
jgi:hypothetical protein